MNRIIISLDEELLKQIDERRSLHGTSRAEFIRRCIQEKLAHSESFVGSPVKRPEVGTPILPGNFSCSTPPEKEIKSKPEIRKIVYGGAA